MSVKKVADPNDLVTQLFYASEALVHFYPRKRGRPPALKREHLKALMRLIKTLVDDIDECIDNMLPEKRQVEHLIKAYSFLMYVKQRYFTKIKALENGGYLDLKNKVELGDEDEEE